LDLGRDVEFQSNEVNARRSIHPAQWRLLPKVVREPKFSKGGQSDLIDSFHS
jgi:hypothetical protein